MRNLNPFPAHRAWHLGRTVGEIRFVATAERLLDDPNLGDDVKKRVAARADAVKAGERLSLDRILTPEEVLEACR